MPRPTRLLLIAGCVLVLGQSPTSVRLSPANGQLSYEFSGISGIRELRDGRLLIADRRENRLLIADFNSDAVSELGRVGNGPGEFQRASRLLAISPDTTAMPDEGSPGRWLMIIDQGTEVRLVTTPAPIGNAFALVMGADTGGNVLFATPVAASAETNRLADSLSLISVNRATRRQDTLARLVSPFPASARAFGTGVAVRRRGATTPPRLDAPRDEALLFPDGWIAILRRTHPRIEWRSSKGHGIRGVSAAVSFGGNKQKLTSLELVSSEGYFGSTPSLIAVPDGRLLAKLPTGKSSDETQYVLIDRRGAATGLLAVTESERVLGFGVKSVYVSTTDESGLQRIRRHPWP